MRLEFDEAELGAALVAWRAARRQFAGMEGGGHSAPGRVCEGADRAAETLARLVAQAFERTPDPAGVGADPGQPAEDQLAALERVLCAGPDSERGLAAIQLGLIGGERAGAILDKGLAANERPNVRAAILSARTRVARGNLASLALDQQEVTR